MHHSAAVEGGGASSWHGKILSAWVVVEGALPATVKPAEMPISPRARSTRYKVSRKAAPVDCMPWSGLSAKRDRSH